VLYVGAVRSSAFGELFRLATIRRQAMAGLVAQVTQGAAGVGIILVVRTHGGSLALAGGVVGAFSVVAAIARPLQGRVIDQRGPRTLMSGCGVLHCAALVAIAVMAQHHDFGAGMVVLGAVAGLALPPVSTTMRALWGRAVPPGERTAAYSLVYLTQELAILCGPLLLAVVIAAAGTSLALITVAAVAGSGTLAFAALLQTGSPRHPPARPGGTFGVLRSPGVLSLMALAVLIGAVIGAVQVAVPTIATAHHEPAAGGLLIATLSIGGIAGAMLYGGLRWQARAATRLLVVLAVLTCAVALMIPVSGLILVGVLLACAGAAFNPSLTTISLLLDERTPGSSGAEAFGWLSAGLSGGTGGASALAAALTHAENPRTAFLLAAVAGAGATLIAAAQGRTARPPRFSRAGGGAR
jgi:MFS family permease